MCRPQRLVERLGSILNFRAISFTLLIGIFVPQVVMAGSFVAFGPKTYVRASGASIADTEAFQVPVAGVYTIKIYNGGLEDDTQDYVSSSVISINGQQLFTPNEFNQNVPYLEKVVSLQDTNQLDVELRGKPGGTLALEVLGQDDIPPTISYTETPESNSSNWHNSDVTVTFSCQDIGSAVLSCTNPVTLSVEGIDQEVIGEAIDLAGNSTTTQAVIDIDKSPPVISISEPLDGSSHTQADLEVTGQVTDNLSTASVTVNGISTSIDSNGNFSQALVLSEGPNAINVSAIDEADNSASTDLVVTLVLDSDGDGVNDSQDLCPNTAVGTPVDDSGCPIIQISITYPVPNQVIFTPTTSVMGTIADSGGNNVLVSKREACVYNNQFVIHNIPVNSGEDSITAEMILASGTIHNAEVIVNRGEQSLFTITPDTDCAVAPFKIVLELENVDPSITQIDIDYENDGITDTTITNLGNQMLEHDFTNPGLYQVKITTTDVNAIAQTHFLNIIAQDGEETNAVIQANWQTIIDELGAGNITQALDGFTASAREKYGPAFTALQNNLPVITASFSDLQVIDINTDYAEYALNRVINGENRLFFVYFVKDENGAWKLDSM